MALPPERHEPEPPVRSRVRAAVERAWARAIEAGVLPTPPEGSMSQGRPAVEVEHPADAEHGDFASTLAMKLARPYRMAPAAIAAALAVEIAREAAEDPASTPIATAEVAPPGFLNLRLADHALEAAIAGVLGGARWPGAALRRIRPRSVNVEFVSANPTGPLHRRQRPRAPSSATCCAGSWRPAASASRASTTSTTRAAQIRNLGASVAALRRGEPVPEDGYRGDYVDDLAPRAPRRTSGPRPPRRMRTRARHRRATGRPAASARGSRRSLARARRPLRRLEERGELHDEGWVGRAVERLRERGHVYEQDGATWFRSTDLRRRQGPRDLSGPTGEPTYFAADIGYVTEKFSRGFDHLIYVWGADHHGTVARVRNAAEAMGYDRDAVQMLLYSAGCASCATASRSPCPSAPATSSPSTNCWTRSASDAARWFFASRAAHAEIDFDIELAKKQSAENPVYYVQYAHARIASILRKAAEAGLAPGVGRGGAARPAAPEAALARAVVRLPGGRRGRGGRRGDAGDHGLRHGAGDRVPRVLPRRAGRGRGRAGAVRRAAGARGGRRRSRSRTPSACWGSPRPTRCRPGRGGGSAMAAISGSPSAMASVSLCAVTRTAPGSRSRPRAARRRS